MLFNKKILSPSSIRSISASSFRFKNIFSPPNLILSIFTPKSTGKFSSLVSTCLSIYPSLSMTKYVEMFLLIAFLLSLLHQ